MSSGIHSVSRGEGPDVLLLHGLFGMGSNLGGLARELSKDHSVHSLDLPNHGRSAWLASMSLEALSTAVVKWMDERSITRAALVGHSLGGKVAMRLALDCPQRVSRLVIADIAPVAYAPHHDAVFAGLEAVAAATPTSRAEADTLLARYIQEESVRQFLLLSLFRTDEGHYRWRFNLAGLVRDYGAVREALEAREPYTGPTLFIKGERSDYILPSHRHSIETLFPNASLKVLRDSGHWLHAEQARLFNAVVRRFLASPEDRPA